MREQIAKTIRDDYFDVMTINNSLEIAGQILALIKKAGYVKLAEDQSLPSIHETGNYIEDLDLLHQEYQNDGWRKVEIWKSP